MVAGPVTTSPAAKTPGRFVARAGFTTKVCERVAANSSRSIHDRSGVWPMAEITQSKLMV